ncbi:hypothetical protein J6590_095768 [Homalodisca vitripennis]|nr:hypothetical protein J6590_095768 [Homalodisca vitripennis]
MVPINQNRMAKCRAKKKSDPEGWEEHLRKDRERNKARRSVKKEERLSDPNLLKVDREKERLRKRAARERKKTDIDETAPQQYDVLASDTPVCGNSDDVEEGDWVIVIYDGWYPGVVDRRDENFLSVNFMHTTVTKFFWPTEADIQTLQPNDILCKIDVPPHPVSNRHFGMLKNTVNQIQELYEKFK